MYESPITIVYGDIQTELKRKTESLIVSCVQNVGVDVNKDELVKALSYDRGQYDKGYADAKAEIVHCKDCKHQEKFWHGDKRRKDEGFYIYGCELAGGYSHVCLDDDYCSRAERRTDG